MEELKPPNRMLNNEYGTCKPRHYEYGTCEPQHYEYGTCKPRHKVFLCNLVVCLNDRLDVRLPVGEGRSK